MRQTPAHDTHNAELLALVPVDARRIVEVGCSSGALAREYKQINPTCHYTGVEIVPKYAEICKVALPRMAKPRSRISART